MLRRIDRGTTWSRVIGAGLGRTGSYSLRVALERLGYDPCHHMSSLGEDPALLAGWESVAEGGEVRWDELMASYRAAVDWPACAFWRPLITVFPQAKVVLTIRDPARWYAAPTGPSTATWARSAA